MSAHFEFSSARPAATSMIAWIRKALTERWITAITGIGMKYDIECCMLSDVGCHRTENEDRLLFVRPSTDLELEHKGLLAVLADGMGGHEGGQIASQIAVDVVSQVYFQQPGDDPIAALKMSFACANRAIYEAARREPAFLGMGTTCSALVLKNGYACFAHVGDSRLYRLRDGALSMLTTDHTMVMELAQSGLFTAEEARHHPRRSILTRVLGTLLEVNVSASEDLLPMQSGDIYILCSDGLYDLVRDEEIQQAVSSVTPPTACERLITLAKERGGYDNISVGILAVREVN